MLWAQAQDRQEAEKTIIQQEQCKKSKEKFKKQPR